MSTTIRQQKLLSYQFLPITQITLHTQQQLRSLKHKGIIPQSTLVSNTQMQQYITPFTSSISPSTSTTPLPDYKKWCKQIDKLCGPNTKLTQIQKIQLFNNAALGIINSEPQLVLVCAKLAGLEHKDRLGVVGRCRFE